MTKPTKFLYFAYGSNMLTERLAARCGSAKPVGMASVLNFGVDFSKPGMDRSGKATLVGRNQATQYGVIFEIALAELTYLDAAEGSGYQRLDAFPAVLAEDGSNISCTTYISRENQEGLQPYDWYLGLIVAGAKQHGLPASTIEEFRSVQAFADPEPNRPARLAALDALSAAKPGQSA